LSATFSAILDVQVTGQDQVDSMSTSISGLNTTITDTADSGSMMSTSMASQVSGFTRVAGSASMLMGSFMMLDMTQMRLQISAQRLQSVQLTETNAQLNYNEAVAKYGPASEQAVKAHDNLEKAILSVDRAQQQLQMRQMQEYVMLLPMGLSIITSLSAAYDTLAESKTVQTMVTNLLNSSLLTEVTLEDMLTLGIGAAAGIAGAAAIYSFYGSHGSPTSAPTGVSSYQGGGTLGTSGLIYGHAGETLISPYGGDYGTPGAMSPSYGGNIGMVNIELGVNARQLLQVTAIEYEYENQRRGPINYGV
jgi:hypothetical protein